MKRTVLFLLFAAASCGGGGGGDDSGGGAGFYAGTWDYAAYKAVDPCSSPLDERISGWLIVNQDGSRVVVNTGQITLTGTTNDDDGFTVGWGGISDNGCETAIAYALTDASDGEADLGLAMGVRCGLQECTVGYGGSALRRDTKSYSAGTRDRGTLDELLAELETCALAVPRPKAMVHEADLLAQVERLAEAPFTSMP